MYSNMEQKNNNNEELPLIVVTGATGG